MEPVALTLDDGTVIRELTDGRPERTLDDAFLASGACSRPRLGVRTHAVGQRGNGAGIRARRSKTAHAATSGERSRRKLDQYTGIRSRTARPVSMIFLAAGIASSGSAGRSRRDPSPSVRCSLRGLIKRDSRGESRLAESITTPSARARSNSARESLAHLSEEGQWGSCRLLFRERQSRSSPRKARAVHPNG